MGWGLAWWAWSAGAAFPPFSVETARDYLQVVALEVHRQAGSGADVCLMLARLQSQLGKDDEAERWARRGLEQEPGRADLQMFLGNLFIRQDRLPEARQCLQKAVELDPKIEGGQRRLGMVLDRLGDHAAARAAFEAAIRQAPDDALARLLLGRLLLDQNQAAEAVPHLERASQLDPKSANALYVLHQAQSRAGHRDAARETLKKFQEAKRQEDAAEEAARAYDNEQTMRGMAAGFHTSAAALFMKLRQPALAEAHLRQAMHVDPQDAPSREMLAALLVQSGRPTPARETYEDLVRLRPTNAAYRVNLGVLLFQLNSPDRAVSELRRALELDPQQPEALLNLARFFLTTRQNAVEALAWCERLVALRPVAANYDLLAWAFYANGRTNEARAALAKALAQEPGNPLYRQRLRQLEENR